MTAAFENTDQFTSPSVALSIAGSDSGGGAGIQADLLTFAAFGVFGTTAITAITAQNTLGVRDIQVTQIDTLEAQIDAVLSDFAVGAVKTGMLATSPIVQLIVTRAKRGELPHLVVDPVMVASSGSSLLVPGARRAYLDLLPYVEVLTPNLAEAEVLLAREIRTRRAMEDAVREFCNYGVKYALIKGGHLQGTRATDILFDGAEITYLEEEMIVTPNVHGTGCTLSAAIAANLARDLDPFAAVVEAKNYLSNCLRAGVGWRLGAGAGPFDHFPGR